MNTASGAARIQPFQTAAQLTAAVKDAARACGARAVRIASAEADEPTRARMRDAFARGDLATWPYDAAYARAASDPATLLHGARSVICIAIAYATPPPRERRGYGRVSAYAWSADYHHRTRALLRTIAERIDELAGAPVTRIVPSRIGGQAKPPSSSHLVARTRPEPSKTRSFKRSDRFERNTKTSPL